MHSTKSAVMVANARPNADFSRIVIGIDFGPASLSAARWATNHVALHADATLAHITPRIDEPDVDAGESVQSIPAISGGLGGFAATLSVESSRTVVRIGLPSHWLSTLANNDDASLLVLGRRADANRRLIGEPNVIERAARRSNASVLVVPEGSVGAPTHVIAAVDEGASHVHVLRVARGIARMHEAPMSILHVLSPGIGSFDRVIRASRPAERPVRSEQAAAVPIALASTKMRWITSLERWHNVRGRDRTDVTLGEPVREIVAAANATPGALIVIGTRGADEAPPLSLGSVARELLTRAPAPVLAVNVPDV